MYSATTNKIRITVKPIYLENQSLPQQHHFVWAYQVQIENLGADTVQLINRYWHITDGLGRVYEVRGPGVVGAQPTLRPREAFEYTSGTPLSTSSGIMRGHYEMRGSDGMMFDAAIPAFSLDLPGQKPVLN